MIGMVTFDLTALVASLSLLVGAVFTGLIGLQHRQSSMAAEDQEELEAYQRWRPRIRILIAELRDRLAKGGIPEPDWTDEALEFPPPKKKPSKKVTTDE